MSDDVTEGDGSGHDSDGADKHANPTIVEQDTLGAVLLRHLRILRFTNVRDLIQTATAKGYIRLLEEYPAIEMDTINVRNHQKSFFSNFES